MHQVLALILQIFSLSPSLPSLYVIPIRLASIEKFSRFSRQLEINVNAMETSYLQMISTTGDMFNSLNILGKDIQRFTKGLQPTTSGNVENIHSHNT